MLGICAIFEAVTGPVLTMIHFLRSGQLIVKSINNLKGVFKYIAQPNFIVALFK